MQLFIADDYQSLSIKAADDLMLFTKAKKNVLVCPASGDSPAGLYQLLVKKVNDNTINIDEWNFLGLDEWVGMNGADEGSCRYHLNNQLFDPLKVDDNKIFFFDGKATNLLQECDHAEQFIQNHGGIDVAILGLGMNGHIGMNEPGTSPALHCHVTQLDTVTQKVGQKYFKQPVQLTQGITLGIATLLKAKHLMLIVSGIQKASIVQQTLVGEISINMPGSLLRNHPGLMVYLDTAAAKLL